MSRQVLSVASECVPLIKSGGLADVTGALPGALRQFGWHMRVMLPDYPGMAERLSHPVDVKIWDDLFGGPARLVLGRARDGFEVLVLSAPHLYDREGGPYLTPEGRDHPDNPERFAALCWAAMEVARDGLADGWQPDLIHAHDWQGALAPVYLRQAAVPVPSVLSIHNIAFQGLAPVDRLASLRLDPVGLNPGLLEFWGWIGALKAGLISADRVATVSPRYATELFLPEFGMGL